MKYSRTPIENQKLIYHLTSLTNVESILKKGLLPRNSLAKFDDVAEAEILEFRGANNLNDCVPFHFFAKNPFDGTVQKRYPDKEFVYICVSREYAKANGFLIIPTHPMVADPLTLYGYEEGFRLIDWELMNRREYCNSDCKHVCMAECVINRFVLPKEFQSIAVETEDAKQLVEQLFYDLYKEQPPFRVNVSTNWFI